MPWPKTSATQYHAQLGLLDKGRAIKGFVVCNIWDLDPWGMRYVIEPTYCRTGSYLKMIR